jgi:outer membrane protein assembly factor BamB
MRRSKTLQSFPMVSQIHKDCVKHFRIQTGMSTAATFALSWFCVMSAVFAADWPQWQGPNRNAVSSESGLLKTWPKDGPPLAWRIKGVGGGDGAPSIAAGQIFGMGNRGGEEVVWALSEKDGNELWATPLGAAVEQRMPQGKEGPGCTPTVDGDRLYVLGMGGSLVCLQADDGKIIWRRSLTEDFGGRAPTWSYRESPLIDGDKVVCTPGGEDAMMVALNKLTGETVWKTQAPSGAAAPSGHGDRPGGGANNRGGFGRGRGGFGRGPASGAAYASAIAIDFGGQRQYVQLTQNALVGVAAADGKLLWRYNRAANRNGINCSTPIYQDGLVFASSDYGAGGGAVRLSKEPNGSIKAEEVYFTQRMQNHHGGMVVVDGALYGANGGNGGGYLTCLDFQTGEVLWSDRAVPKGSLAMADGRIYYRTEDGAVLLIEPNRERYVERGRFEQPDRTDLPAWSHPVIANGRLYIRDQDVLFCYNIADKSP